MTQDDKKKQWRKHFQQLRAAIPAEERERADAGISRQLLTLPEYRQAEAVLAYLSFGDEVETRDIMRQAWADGKTVLLPRCIPGTRGMAWYRVESFEGMVKSSFGVDEPAEDPVHEIDLDTVDNVLVLVPGLTFDPQGYRLGYGGGFYDVFLSGFAAAPDASMRRATAGLCRACQLVDHVEDLDSHDLPADIVVTEEAVYRS